MVSRGEATDEVILVRLHHPFRCIDSVIIRLDELPLACFLGEKFLERLCCLIVCDVEQWLVPLGQKRVEDALECLDDCLVCHAGDGFCEDVVGIIIVRDEVALVHILGSCW